LAPAAFTPLPPGNIPSTLFCYRLWRHAYRGQREEVLFIILILQRLRVFENRVLRRVFGPKRDEVTRDGENYIMRSLGIFTPYPILCGW